MTEKVYTETIKVVADILAHFMNLTQERIFIYNDGRELPKDNGLYLVLSIQSRKPYGTRSQQKNINGVFREVLTTNVAERLICSICSKNSDARTRSFEVQMAMTSDYAQQMMDLYGFHISQIADVQDRSFLEQTARLNRFDCEINCLTAYEKIQGIDYYDQFPINTVFQSR